MLKKTVTVFVVVIFLAALVAIMMPVFVNGHTPARVNVCRDNMKVLRTLLLLYVDDTGVFPDSSKWLERLYQHNTSRYERLLISEHLKCPDDKTSSKCSYEMNPDLSGKKLKEIPEKDREKIVLLKEKIFPGSHGLIVAIDGFPSSRSNK